MLFNRDWFNKTSDFFTIKVYKFISQKKFHIKKKNKIGQ